MLFSPLLPAIVLYLLGAAVCSLVALLLIYIYRVRAVAAFRRKADASTHVDQDARFRPASVIVYSQGDPNTLEEVLRSILEQHYPAPFEVIVVHEGESTEASDIVSILRAQHRNLYLTFTPEGVVNLSRKKLALTLGIKAARYNTVVLTTTAVEIQSPMWLRSIMAGFNTADGIEVVIGAAYTNPDDDTAMGKRRRAFDSVADSTRWLATAIAGKPFRGTEYNIAYSKDLFMKNKGFARTLNLHYGDDDIFISEIARPGNTAVVLNAESIVCLRHGNHPRIFRERMLRRNFTESFIRRRPRILHQLTGWLQILIIALGITASALAWPNLFAPAAALLLVLITFGLDIWVWRQMMRTLNSRKMFLTIPYLSMTYPIRMAWYKMLSKTGKHKKYTWN